MGYDKKKEKEEALKFEEEQEESESSYSSSPSSYSSSPSSYENNNKQESSVYDDSDTVTTGKVGSDWKTLTENQKFHAVSNAMYSLDQSGYTITASEDSFINALDTFYSAGNNDVAVTEALVNIGLLSGTIYR